MEFRSLDNYLLIPAKDQGETIVYELQKSGPIHANAAVLIPYVNPQTTKIEPQFFQVKDVRREKLLIDINRRLPNFTLKATTSKDQYIKNVLELKKHIGLGNIYEINYCINFISENTEVDPVLIFHRLQNIAKAPYSRLLKTGNYYIISASPELFLKKEKQHLFTKPIKGTIRRGVNNEEDLSLKNDLFHNLKERTENVMAVDVARNDLSILATKGSVNVNKLYNIESFETVHQMVSTVSCEIKPGVSFADILNATFPMASMTGAPKKRAMDLIGEFENFNRGAYSGAIGLIDENGDFELSVIIRSIFYNASTKTVSIAVGSAITYLSDPEKEYDECLLKANTMLKALNATLA